MEFSRDLTLGLKRFAFFIRDLKVNVKSLLMKVAVNTNVGTVRSGNGSDEDWQSYREN